jgi:hypothetical protein
VVFYPQRKSWMGFENEQNKILMSCQVSVAPRMRRWLVRPRTKMRSPGIDPGTNAHSSICVCGTHDGHTGSQINSNVVLAAPISQMRSLVLYLLSHKGDSYRARANGSLCVDERCQNRLIR